MQPLYRYLPSAYVDAFIRNGEMLMRSLSYYRDYEDASVRGDPLEGTLLHRPNDGLRVTMIGTGEVRPLPHTFASTAREEDIFVYCLSAKLSQDIARKFGTDLCVEIHKPIQFLHRLRMALALRSGIRTNALVHGHVGYYEPQEPPIVDWALPERIVMRKPSHLSWQHEYRVAVPRGDAFRVQDVSVKLVLPGAARPARAGAPTSIPLKLGSLSKLCRVHRL